MRECKGCLIREMDWHNQYEQMYSYIEHLDETIKTHPQVYQIRLRTCKGCKSLMNGMCKHCGCFVEMRAAIAVNSCPRHQW